ncbi:deoxynucleoside kinase [Gilvimarinus sp. F26214L]|uniref:deoxynucleoside kinase n=1 Tax=Gilvimarinus sp. DZF01 TaxID=3461371 RepID=UPI004045F497
MTTALNLKIDHDPDALPRYIAIEGPIGVGKTSLAKNLAKTFGYETLLERTEDNPFLERFYQDQRTHALPTQLHFLFERAKQLQELRQGDMFEPVRIADFLIEKDQLFAQVTLNDDEFRLYQQVYDQLTLDTATPDIVVYLQAPVEILAERIRGRGNPAERYIDHAYLEGLNEAYTRFFHYYDRSPLLIVNSADFDLVGNERHYKQFVEYLLSIKSGRHYYNPSIL